MKIKIFIYCCFCILLLGSCSVKKHINTEYSYYPDLSEKKFLKTQNSLDKQWSALEYSKFTASYNDGSSKRSFKGYVRLKTDSIIMISVAPVLGIEMFRMQMKKDSVGLINRYSKEYILENTRSLFGTSGFPYDLDIVQFLLSGNFECIAKHRESLRNFKKKDSYYTLEYYFKDDDINTSIECFYNEMLLLKKVLVHNYHDNNTLNISYLDYFMDQNRATVPKRMKVDIVKGNTLEILEIEIKKVVFNKKMTFPFSVSKSYQRVNHL